MAIYNLKMEPDKNRSAVLRYEYILRENNFSWNKNEEKYNDFIFAENVNMPSFAKDNPKHFWECAEANEAINANVFRTIDFSLATELTDEENIELATNFAKELFGDQFVYSLAVHSKPSEDPEKRNIHCHIMFCEREVDGIERNEEQFFKRANTKKPSLGGAKKNREWQKYAKLYSIRKTWEKMLNEKLQEKGIELVSCKSLKAQRQEAIQEGNFLKAEMLDRPAINLKKEYIDFAPDSEEKEEKITFFNYCKELKRIKEKEFKLKSENFEEENLKAKERYYKALYEKEGREYIPSDFDVNAKEGEAKEREAEQNLENMFVKSLDNHILLARKESRLAQIESITEADIESRALNILTKGEYQKNLERLTEYNDLYNSLNNKEEFKYTAQKKELEEYFLNLKQNEYFQNKLSTMQENIKEKYSLEKEEILNELVFLRNNPFKDFAWEKNGENIQRSKRVLLTTMEKINLLKKEKEEIDKKVKEYKENNLNVNLREQVYRKIRPDVADKYLELARWKKEYENLKSLDDKLELVNRIKAREKGLKVFDIDNDINDKVKEELSTRRAEYKELRKEQDDVNGRLSYSYLILKELKLLKEYNLLEEEKSYKDKAEQLDRNNKLAILEYNTRRADFQSDYNKAFNKSPDIEEIKVKFSSSEKEKYKKELNTRIKTLQQELEELRTQIVSEELNDNEIKIKILDEKTNDEYSKDLAVLAYYKKRKEEGLTVSEANLEKIENRVKELENSFKISPEDIEIKRQVIREQNIKTVSNIVEKSKTLNIYFKMLKKLKVNRLRLGNSSKNNHSSSPRLKVVKSGRIEFEDEKEKRRRENEWER